MKIYHVFVMATVLFCASMGCYVGSGNGNGHCGGGGGATDQSPSVRPPLDGGPVEQEVICATDVGDFTGCANLATGYAVEWNGGYCPSDGNGLGGCPTGTPCHARYDGQETIYFGSCL